MASNNSDIDSLANKIDELLCETTLPDLKAIGQKVGIIMDMTNKTKRQVRGFITKYYEGILEDNEKSEDEQKRSLEDIIDVINQCKNAEQQPENRAAAENANSHGEDSKTEVKQGETSK